MELKDFIKQAIIDIANTQPGKPFEITFDLIVYPDFKDYKKEEWIVRVAGYLKPEDAHIASKIKFTVVT